MVKASGYVFQSGSLFPHPRYAQYYHMTPGPGKQQITVQVGGVVQGVGFRPFVYSLANNLGLAGQVANTNKGVEIFLSGSKEDVDRFLHTLKTSPPPLARITDMVVSDCPGPEPEPGFIICTSRNTGDATTLISPDIATCGDCLADIFSPGNRRFHYPFTNCTNCGPRMTIIRKIPYDRPNTAMASFPLCPACRREYEDPGDRRFHAQPNACPSCGPRISLHDNKGNLLTKDSEQCLSNCASTLQEGRIVAIKGLGGFHLAVDAFSNEAVLRLRRKKQRYAKPLAVMAKDVATAATICRLGKREREILASRKRPIVLAPAITDILSLHLAPGLDEIGVMLPYTPLHHLLFAQPQCPKVLVMTSGNLSSEPICITNRDALARLGAIADLFLFHNRNIVTRVDDSVVRGHRKTLQILRRSRGYTPDPVTVANLPGSILACGAELKNTFCLTRPGQAFLSQHIGDLKGPDNLVFYQESIRYLQDVLQINPEIVVCDLHPDYLSSRYAKALELPCIPVQHHHAHAGAVMAEHGLDNGLAVVFDGAGLGSDGTIWGGEFLLIEGKKWKRLAHLDNFPLPGCDRATREIWRLGLALLAGSGINIRDTTALPKTLPVPGQTLTTLAAMIEGKINTPLTSSVGRLFDGVATLLGIRREVDFEGQAAMELETLARQAYKAGIGKSTGQRYQATVSRKHGQLRLDYRPLVNWLLEDVDNNTPAHESAWFFHIWLVRSTLAIILALVNSQAATGRPMENIILAGGCFQNTLLLGLLTDKLEKHGLKVYTGNQVPVNDGGIALGQAYVAGMGLCGHGDNQYQQGVHK